MSISQKSIREKRFEELRNAEIVQGTERNASLIEYIAMMQDLELPAKEEAVNNEMVR